MNKIIFIISLIVSILVISGCVAKISDIKNEDLVGKRVTVHGIVESTIKFGKISGYVLKDNSGSIGVYSQSLPEEGTEKTVNGILIKDTFLGYYIKTDE